MYIYWVKIAIISPTYFSCLPRQSSWPYFWLKLLKGKSTYIGLNLFFQAVFTKFSF